MYGEIFSQFVYSLYSNYGCLQTRISQLAGFLSKNFNSKIGPKNGDFREKVGLNCKYWSL